MGTACYFRVLLVGGGKRDRTADLLHAMQALSQLSYTPTQGRELYHRLYAAWRCRPRRASTVSRPSSSSTASSDGVCVRPVISRRAGIATAGILRPVALS